MKVQLIGEPKIIMSNPHSKHNYFGWPTVTRLQNGKLAAVASGYRLAHVCPFGKAVISFSEDEGETWTLPAPVIDTMLDDRDGGILAFGENSVIVTSGTHAVEFQKKYAKETEAPYPSKTEYPDYVLAYLDTVTPEENDQYLGATYRISNDGGVTFGELCMSKVFTPHGPILRRDGTILWIGEKRYPNGLHCVQAQNFQPDGTFEFLSEIVPPVVDGVQTRYYEPYGIELEDGTILCQIRMGGGKADFSLCQTESYDGGKSWTKPHQLLDDLGGAPAHLLLHSSGILISVYGYRLDKPYGVKVMFSTDNGKNWSESQDIYCNNVVWDLGYPSTVELKDGSLLTVFYAHPEEGAPAVIMQQRWKLEE